VETKVQTVKILFLSKLAKLEHRNPCINALFKPRYFKCPKLFEMPFMNILQSHL
jgi:hypothetical protein